MTPNDLTPAASALVASIQAQRDAQAKADGVFVFEGPGVDVVTIGIRFNGHTTQTHTYDMNHESWADIERYTRALERKLSQLQRRHLKIVI